MPASLLVVLSGCVDRPLTRPEQLNSGQKIIVASAIALPAALLVLHAARWMLGRPPRRGDANAFLLAGAAVLAIATSALIVLCHLRADDLLTNKVGAEPTTIIGLQADCGVTSGDDFLEFYVNYESCSVDHSGRGLAVPLALIGVGLLGLGRWQRHSAWTRAAALVSGVPIALLGFAGFYAVASGMSKLIFWTGAILTVLAVCSRISAWADARGDSASTSKLS